MDCNTLSPLLLSWRGNGTETGTGHGTGNETRNGTRSGGGHRREHGRGNGHRHQSRDREGDEHGHRHRHRSSRHRHHHSPENEECCKWLNEVDSSCVCDLLIRLPHFLRRTSHAILVNVRNSCNVTYECQGRFLQ
ncbi:hypothetical protein IFM89_001003 [Coptis chinensis]|uniref:Bifunctional inhibitor/plant lipid transfer protein/seed storage helical domain-containing protein n=1 Tax=Coptis chinensis TaxID=261450 RepID=A0A835M3K6_9MAGN|nr:hypothetical protein IFM89_001003 [Coptis chinensis]